MWKPLPMQGAPVTEVRLEGSGKDRDIILLPKTGERLRIPAIGDVTIETVGRVIVRTSSIDDVAMRITFLGELVLEVAEVMFEGSEGQWQGMWRRARTRSRPWWRQGEAQEIELDQALHARFVVAGATPSRPPKP